MAWGRPIEVGSRGNPRRQNPLTMHGEAEEASKDFVPSASKGSRVVIAARPTPAKSLGVVPAANHTSGYAAQLGDMNLPDIPLW
jgi:hypothetical protein